MRAESPAIVVGLLISLFLLAMISQQVVVADSALLSERTYKRLSAIHELMGEEKYKEALKRLNVLAKTVSNRKYENAVVKQTYGYLYVAIDQPHKAIDAFTQSLESQALPQPAQQNVRLNLAQLYFSVDQNRKAVSVYEAWIKLEKTPSPAGYALGGTLYAAIKSYAPAAKYLKSAIAAAKKPREEWYRLLLAVYYEDKKYSQAASLLKEMITRFPARKEYWQQLSAIYSTLGKDRESLAALQLAYLNGLLTSEKELLNLARYYMYMDMPYKAVQLIKTATQKGLMQASQVNLELLYQACLRANELEEAVNTLHRLSEVSEDKKFLVEIAHLKTEMGHWAEANRTITQAIGEGGLDDAGRAYLIQGITFYELDQPAKAIKAFERARQHKETENQAQQWLAFLRASHTAAYKE
jgi:predicted Zn-dependent protease